MRRRDKILNLVRGNKENVSSDHGILISCENLSLCNNVALQIPLQPQITKDIITISNSSNSPQNQLLPQNRDGSNPISYRSRSPHEKLQPQNRDDINPNTRSSSCSSTSSSSSSSSNSSNVSDTLKSKQSKSYAQPHNIELIESLPSTSNFQRTLAIPSELPQTESLSSSPSRPGSKASLRTGDFSPDDNDSDYNPPHAEASSESSNSEPENIPSPEVSPPKKKRKGVVKSKKKIAKELRNLGKTYISLSKSKKVVPERRMGAPCAERCRLKCLQKINEYERKIIFDQYWTMGCITRQRDFINKHLTIIQPKYSYKRENSNRKPKHGFHLTVKEIKVRVCKIFFKNTLGINDRPIRTVLEKMSDSGVVESEKRGKHGNQIKVLDGVVQGIRYHIDSIPRIESHYLRKQTSRDYIDGGKNLMDLYRDYKDLCEKEGRPAGAVHTYRKIFNRDYNISFFIPKKDMCEFCAAYENMEPADKEENLLKYLEHHSEKYYSRVEKYEDKHKAQENYIVACYDLQAVLPLPLCKTSAFYYRSKLNVCNFTICELTRDTCYCYVWSEIDSLRGANEIGSCVIDFIKEKAQAVDDPNLEIVFYSDNCCGQQKNQFMFGMYMYALANFKIKSITHKFLITGHTQNENDNVHSVIEKQVKKFLKSSPIYVPEQYITLIKSARKQGNSYNVKGMLYSDFYNLKDLAQKCGTKFNKNTVGDTVRISDIKVIKFVKEEAGDIRIFYKNTFTDDRFFEIEQGRESRTRRTVSRVSFPLKQLNDAKLELSARKKNDLKSLIDSNLIPRYYAESFYNGIL